MSTATVLLRSRVLPQASEVEVKSDAKSKMQEVPLLMSTLHMWKSYEVRMTRHEDIVEKAMILSQLTHCRHVATQLNCLHQAMLQEPSICTQNHPGDAQLLRVISEAMQQPGRTPETVAAEIAGEPKHVG